MVKRERAPGAGRRGAGKAGRDQEGARGSARAKIAALSDRTSILLLVVLIGAFFHPLLLGGQVFSSPDAQAPQGFGVYAEAWRARTGDYPLWNPFIFCGIPSYSALAYNPDVYFPDWIFKLFGDLAPPMLWLVAYYMLGAIALYFFLRDWGALPGPALLGGLLFALTPNLIAVGAHGHGSQLVNSGLIPAALLALHRYLARGGLSWLALLALVLGCQLLRGHVQIAYYTWLVLAIYLAFYVAGRRRRDSSLAGGGGAAVPIFTVPLTRGLGGAALAFLLAAGLGAVLILPVAAYTPYSIRGGGPEGGVPFTYATSWSLGWAELLTLIVPSALGFGGATYWGTMPFTDYPNTMGILTLFFAAFSIAISRGRGQGFFILIGLLGLLVALGKNFFLYDLLYRALPYWKKFRVPVMILVLTQLATASLFALGLTRLLVLAREATPRAARVGRLLGRLAILCAVLLGLVLAGTSIFKERYAAAFRASPRIMALGRERPGEIGPLAGAAATRAHGDLVRVLALLALASGGGSFLLVRRRLSPMVYLAGVGLMSAIDVVPIDLEIMKPVTAPRDVLTRVTEPDPVTRFLTAQSGHFRIFPIEEFRSNRFATFGIASVGGYHAAKPRAYQEFMDAFGVESLDIFRRPERHRILDFLNVRYLVTGVDLGESDRFTRVHQGPTSVYENRAAGPRAFLVGEVVVEPDPARALARLADPALDLTRQAVVASPVDSLAGPALAGSARVVEHELNWVTVEVESSGPALLVLGELYLPGWRAAVDGEPTPIVRTDYIARGVRVEAGAHRVRFDYTAPGLRSGLALSLAAGGLILGLGGVGVLRVRRPRERGA